jgi:hypothetical protein
MMVLRRLLLHGTALLLFGGSCRTGLQHACYCSLQIMLLRTPSMIMYLACSTVWSALYSMYVFSGEVRRSDFK